MDKGARKQYLTQRSDGPRPSTQQLLTSPFVVRMPHVMEAASRLQVQTTLGGLLRNTGAHVDLERAIPELFTWHGQRCTEAILDAAIRWPTSLHTTVVDITVRCPHASRYGGGVTASPTAAAEDEKHKRNGPQVTPIAFSTYGRLGREGRNAMEALAAEARWNSDDPSNQRSQVAKWRNTLEQSLLHAQADPFLSTVADLT